jgi:hypothetical protein
MIEESDKLYLLLRCGVALVIGETIAIEGGHKVGKALPNAHMNKMKWVGNTLIFEGWGKGWLKFNAQLSWN